MSAFDRNLQAILDRAEEDAREDGSATVEAQHVLLAIAAHDAEGQRVLTAAGLDHRTLKDALRREFAHSLSGAGVSLDAFALRSTPDPGHRPRIGASFKLALERMASSHRKRDLRQVHVLLAILRAEVGTVPRALALAGVDRAELVERVREAL